MPTEVEAKFRADGPGPLEALAGVEILGRAVLGPARTVDETDRYLDTDDGRLAAALWACRLRSREGTTRVSLKGPPSEDAMVEPWHHRRPEVEGPATDEIAPASWPPSEARALLESLAGGGALAERLRVRQRRTERAVTLDGGGPIGTITLDRVRLAAGATDLGELFVVELELDPASDRGEAELPGLAGALAAVPGLVAEPRTKLEHALHRLHGRR
jgi:inorganic triphosphatase YgiF